MRGRCIVKGFRGGGGGALHVAQVRARPANVCRYQEAFAPLATYLEAVGDAAPDADVVRGVLARVQASLKRERG